MKEEQKWEIELLQQQKFSAFLIILSGRKRAGPLMGNIFGMSADLPILSEKTL